MDHNRDRGTAGARPADTRITHPCVAQYPESFYGFQRARCACVASPGDASKGDSDAASAFLRQMDSFAAHRTVVRRIPFPGFVYPGDRKIWGRTGLVKGPIEGFRDKLAELEARAGLRPISRHKGPKPEGKLGPGGKWLLRRLGTDHPERLSLQEEHMLGWALVYEMEGNLAEAQELLDMLSEHHRLRLDLEQKGLAEEPGDDATELSGKKNFTGKKLAVAVCRR